MKMLAGIQCGTEGCKPLYIDDDIPPFSDLSNKDLMKKYNKHVSAVLRKSRINDEVIKMLCEVEIMRRLEKGHPE